MKAKVYIETTIPSYLVARPSRDLLIAAHQQLTRDWWESRGPAFDLYVSEPVLEESAAGDTIMARKRLELLADIRVLALTTGTEIRALTDLPYHRDRDNLRLRVFADLELPAHCKRRNPAGRPPGREEARI